MSQTLRFFLNQALKQWLTGRKRKEDGNTNDLENKILKNKKDKILELFRSNESHLQNKNLFTKCTRNGYTQAYLYYMMNKTVTQ